MDHPVPHFMTLAASSVGVRWTDLVGLGDSLNSLGVRIVASIIIGALILAAAAIAVLAVLGRLSPGLRSELIKRTAAWAVMAPLVILPLLFGKLTTVVLFTVLGLLCYREFARATGLFREKRMSALVAIGIVSFNLAALDHWWALFTALPALVIVVLLVAAILKDQPKGYLQRVGLSILSVLLFGYCLSHLSYFANEPRYRAPVMALILVVAFNDVFAFCVGKTIGGPKLAPNTSPGKTVSGAVGAIVLTTFFGGLLAHTVITGPIAEWPHAFTMAFLVSIAGILGDLTISSVKRDVGVKDMGAVIPGHGGVLDRCNSLLLAAPVLFHYVGYIQGVGLEQPTRILF
jgi:phosphatidate cytidylyltransferase